MTLNQGFLRIFDPSPQKKFPLRNIFKFFLVTTCVGDNGKTNSNSCKTDQYCDLSGVCKEKKDCCLIDGMDYDFCLESKDCNEGNVS